MLTAPSNETLSRIATSIWSNRPVRVVLRFSCVVLLVAGLTFVAHCSLGRPAIGIDDANIFFVYARNLAHGNGFVYNVGGERVEGFTSLLWVLVCGAVYRLTPHPEPWLLGLNVVLVSASLTALATFLEERLDPHLLGGREQPLFSASQIAFLAWTLTSPAFIVHTTLTLMDTGLWTCAFVAAALLALGHEIPARGASGLAFAAALVLLLATRPEAMLWAPLFLAVAFLRQVVRGDDPPRVVNHLALPAVACALAVAGMTLLRIAYFGQPLPNTYYAKVGPDLAYRLSQGFTTYLREFLRSNAFISIAVLASFTLLLERLTPRRASASGLRPPAEEDLEVPDATNFDGRAWSALVLLGLFVPVYLGGDHFAAFRFYQPFWPLLVLPPLYLLVAIRRRANASFNRFGLGYFKAVAAFALVVVLHSAGGSAWLAVPRKTGLAHEFRLAEAGRETGRVLAATFGSELPSVGVYAAGGIAFTYPGQVLDLMGLNLREMANAPGDRAGIPGHSAFNRTVFYRLQPDIVFPEIDRHAEPDFHVDPFAEQIVDGLFRDQRFGELYVKAAVRSARPGLQAPGITAWFHRRFLDRVPAAGLTIRRVDAT